MIRITSEFNGTHTSTALESSVRLLLSYPIETILLILITRSHPQICACMRQGAPVFATRASTPTIACNLPFCTAIHSPLSAPRTRTRRWSLMILYRISAGPCSLDRHDRASRIRFDKQTYPYLYRTRGIVESLTLIM